jgi:hypothetical protein
MVPITGPHNNTHPGNVATATSVGWSQRRAWHGDKVKVFLHAELTKPNPPAAVQILPKDKTAEFDTVSGTTLSAYASGCDYEIKWKGKPFAKDREFQLKAKVDGKLESGLSAPLYVELDAPGFSA